MFSLRENKNVTDVTLDALLNHDRGMRQFLISGQVFRQTFLRTTPAAVIKTSIF